MKIKYTRNEQGKLTPQIYQEAPKEVYNEIFKEETQDNIPEPDQEQTEKQPLIKRIAQFIIKLL